MSTSELACVYAALILHDDGLPITSDKLLSLIAAANIEIEPIWATLFAKALDGKNISDFLFNVGSGSGAAPAPAASSAAPAAGKKEEAKKVEKEEEKEESDDDMGMGLFD